MTTTAAPSSPWRGAWTAGRIALAGAEEALERSTCRLHGMHPAVGALDVCPLVWLREEDRAAARTEAGRGGGQIGGSAFRSSSTASWRASPATPSAPTSATAASRAVAADEGGELRPTSARQLPHPRGGVTLVTARPPLAAFNVELAGGRSRCRPGGRPPNCARRGEGWPGCGARVDPFERPRPGLDQRPRPVGRRRRRRGRGVRRWRRLSARVRSRPSWSAIPAGALVDYPADLPFRGFDPELHVIERRLAASD